MLKRLTVVGLALACAGCSDGNPFDYVPVSGRLMYEDGTPIPAGGIRSAAVTDRRLQLRREAHRFPIVLLVSAVPTGARARSSSRGCARAVSGHAPATSTSVIYRQAVEDGDVAGRFPRWKIESQTIRGRRKLTCSTFSAFR